MKGQTKIKLEGHLDKKWISSFEDMEINYVGNNTMITGYIKDEAHLHGILNRIRDFNLKLLSVNPDETNNK